MMMMSKVSLGGISGIADNVKEEASGAAWEAYDLEDPAVLASRMGKDRERAMRAAREVLGWHNIVRDGPTAKVLALVDAACVILRFIWILFNS